jgi:hemerythrin-like domain-containing protein
MKPIGPLMIEHRLIERMIKLLENISIRAGEDDRVSVAFLEQAVDFLRTYADRTHHGKEEDILFRELLGKKLSDAHEKTMNELIEEHRYARKAVRSLVDAREAYIDGDSQALGDILSIIRNLTGFYRAHIRKEDKDFFIPCMGYFSQGEQDLMLEEFRQFDRNMIGEKYRKVVETYEDAAKLG